jgi:tetratricopeptide (TPR) repeat protein
VQSKDEMLAEAKRLRSSGQLAEAEQLYRTLLAADPAGDNVDAWLAHGSLCRQLGMEREALKSLKRAARLRPADAHALHELGVVLARMGRFEQAVAMLEQAQRLQPGAQEIADNLRFTRACLENQRGAVLMGDERFAQAEPHFRSAIALVPDDADAHSNLGMALKAQNRLHEAIACFRACLALAPNHVDATAALAGALLAQEKWREAEDAFRQAIAHDPYRADLHVNLGNALKMQERLDEARECYHEALKLDPLAAEAHNNLGAVLMSQGKPAEAIASYDRAISLKPDYAHARANRATALLMDERIDEAEVELDHVLRLEPAHRQARFNLGFIRMEQNRPDEALACYEQILERDPADADAHYHRAMTLLAVGRFAEGWAEYEWRWKRPGKAECPLAQPRWAGEPLAGRTILVRGEQGLGDCIQFVRFADRLKEQGATVVVECEPALVRLVERARGVERVVAMGGPLPPFDVHVPMLSVPALVGTTLESIPRTVPYLAPDAAAVAAWQPQLGAPGGYKIGVSWRGNPANVSDRRRSFALAELAPLAATSGVRLISLQVGAGREELSGVAASWPILDLGGRVHDLHDTAAAMLHLDLVITCDSAAAHLAGALGIPAWIALPFAADWRWMLDRDDSPWYPSVRLFRQLRAGDWAGVFRRIAEELAVLVSRATARQPIG